MYVNRFFLNSSIIRPIEWRDPSSRCDVANLNGSAAAAFFPVARADTCLAGIRTAPASSARRENIADDVVIIQRLAP